MEHDRLDRPAGRQRRRDLFDRLPIGGPRKSAQVFTYFPCCGMFSASCNGVLLPMTTDRPAPDEPSPGLVLYTSPDGSARLQLRIEHKTLWLTQAQMASIFQTTK